jgi:hypothetical protein
MIPSPVELLDRPLETVNPAGEDLEEAVHDPIPLLRIDLLTEIHRAFEIREEHGHLLALALEDGLGLQDLLGEVVRGVGAHRYTQLSSGAGHTTRFDPC